jgi:hypothetical protein
LWSSRLNLRKPAHSPLTSEASSSNGAQEKGIGRSRLMCRPVVDHEPSSSRAVVQHIVVVFDKARAARHSTVYVASEVIRLAKSFLNNRNDLCQHVFNVSSLAPEKLVMAYDGQDSFPGRVVWRDGARAWRSGGVLRRPGRGRRFDRQRVRHPIALMRKARRPTARHRTYVKWSAPRLGTNGFHPASLSAETTERIFNR